MKLRRNSDIQINYNLAVLMSTKTGNIDIKNVISPAQCRAARAMLEWSRKRLAAAAEVAERTLIDFERGARQPYRRTLQDIRRTFEDAGVVFIERNGGGPGVRLKE